MVGQVAARRAAGVILEMIKVIGCGKDTIFEHLLLRSNYYFYLYKRYRYKTFLISLFVFQSWATFIWFLKVFKKS